MARNVVPSGNLVDGLGTSSKNWKWLYAGEVHIGDAIVLKEVDGALAISIDAGATFKAAVTPTLTYAHYLNLGTPAVADTTSVMSSGYSSESTEGTLTATLDIPRNLQMVFPMSWDGGHVTVVGTDAYDAVASETFTVSVSTTVVGNVAFKTLTGISKVSVGVDTDDLNIGVGNKFGTGAVHTESTATIFSTGSSPISFGDVDLTYGTIEVVVDGTSAYSTTSPVQFEPETF